MILLMLYHSYQEFSINDQFLQALDGTKQKNIDYDQDYQQCSKDLAVEKESYDKKMKDLDENQRAIKKLESDLKNCKSDKAKVKTWFLKLIVIWVKIEDVFREPMSKINK